MRIRWIRVPGGGLLCSDAAAVAALVAALATPTSTIGQTSAMETTLVVDVIIRFCTCVMILGEVVKSMITLLVIIRQNT